MNIMALPRIHPYVGVSRDTTVEHNGNQFRVIIYGAYDAHGLIGSEVNGIAIFDVTKRQVLIDGECRIGSGWCGPDETQLQRYDQITSMSTEEFRSFVNGHKRARYFI